MINFLSKAGLLVGLLLLCCLTLEIDASGKPVLPKPKRNLKRSDGKRWNRMKDIVSSQIRVNAKKFLEERQKVQQTLSSCWIYRNNTDHGVSAKQIPVQLYAVFVVIPLVHVLPPGGRRADDRL